MRHSGTRRVDPEGELRRLKTELLASVNHEVRTPLSGIVGMMDLLEETGLTLDQQQYVAATRTCAEELLRSLNAALEYAALVAGQFTLDPAPFNVPECLNGAVEAYHGKAAAKGVDLRLEISGDLPGLAVGDAARLREVLEHVIDNGVKYTSAGWVVVRASASETGPDSFVLSIDVSDTGPGVPLDRAARIFDALQHGETGFDRAYAGLGLGLPLSARILAKMNGTIDLKSTEGKGSEFRIRVPLRLPETSPRPAPLPESLCKRVLVVEDNALAARVAGHVLQRAGYTVDTAVSGEAAIAAAASKRYGLILMDLEMPGMGGLAAAREIRRMQGCAEVPILALTAHSGPEYRRRCISEGMQGFLSKPVRATELLASVRRAARR